MAASVMVLTLVVFWNESRKGVTGVADSAFSTNPNRRAIRILSRDKDKL